MDEKTNQIAAYDAERPHWREARHEAVEREATEAEEAKERARRAQEAERPVAQ